MPLRAFGLFGRWIRQPSASFQSSSLNALAGVRSIRTHARRALSSVSTVVLMPLRAFGLFGPNFLVTVSRINLTVLMPLRAFGLFGPQPKVPLCITVQVHVLMPLRAFGLFGRQCWFPLR